jgi:hypothetical protein
MSNIKEMLDEFMIQAGADNPRTSHYQKEYSDLRVINYLSTKEIANDSGD